MNHKSRKNLSAKGLLSIVNNLAKELPGQINGDRKKPIALADCIMSGLAIFGLKYPSLLAFDNDHKSNPTVGPNLKKLYHVQNLPCDTYLRERLDEVNPELLRIFFTKIFHELQRGKVLKEYKSSIKGTYLLSIDGTGIFESKSIQCKNCCIKRHENGTKSCYHNCLVAAIVNQSMKTVIPFPPEPITKEYGATKNGSEQKAVARFIDNLTREHPHLKFTILADSLHATGPTIRKIREAGHNYILNAKPGNHQSLFEFVEGICTELTIKKNGKIYQYRYVNKVPLNDSHPDILVNFFECIETDSKNKKKTFSWVTNITITKKNIHKLMEAGRARWHIENETINTLKNQGYQFEHNFGHGKNNLSTIFAMLMMLAFLIDQVQQQCDALFQAALQKVGRKIYFWERIRSVFFNFFINSWEDLWKGLAFGHKVQSFAFG